MFPIEFANLLSTKYQILIMIIHPAQHSLIFALRDTQHIRLERSTNRLWRNVKIHRLSLSMILNWILTPFLGAHIIAHLALIAKGDVFLLEELSADWSEVFLTRPLASLLAGLSIRFNQLRLALITARTLLHLQQTSIMENMATLFIGRPDIFLLRRAFVLHAAVEQAMARLSSLQHD